MTKLLLTITAALAVIASSCHPVKEPPQKPVPKKPTPEEEAKLKAEEERKKAEEELKKKQEEANANNPGGLPGTDNQLQPPPPPEPPVRRDYPFANKVPGKDGFVFSPYNNKVVDVREIPSGTLVADPTYPPAEKKYFRVP